MPGSRGFLADLGEVLRGRDFRKLFVTRLASQCGDGSFQVGLAGLFFFSPERATTAAGIAAAFAVSVLPYSVLGPFVGVLLDRWPRRQVLVAGNAVRTVLTLGIAGLVFAHVVGPLLYAAVLVCMSVNRFLLAGLGASLPHVVLDRELVMANAVTPTSGTLSAMVGALLGYGLRVAIGAGDAADAGVVALGALLYATASALATRMPRDLLGPDVPPPGPDVPPRSPATAPAPDTPDPHTPGPSMPAPDPAAPVAMAGGGLYRDAVGMLAELRSGLHHLRTRPVAATALAAIGVHRFGFGAATVMTVLLCRYRLAPAGHPDRGLTLLTAAVGVVGAGYAVAALVTPSGSAWLGTRGWMTACLAVTALIPVALVAAASTPVLLAVSFVFGLTGQSVKICVDALVQTVVDDDVRGRAFSVYDMIYNGGFVAAVAGSALVLPVDGYSRTWLLFLGALYLSAAGGYGWVNRRWRAPAALVSGRAERIT